MIFHLVVDVDDNIFLKKYKKWLTRWVEYDILLALRETRVFLQHKNNNKDYVNGKKTQWQGNLLCI